jgi:hypothetical protein
MISSTLLTLIVIPAIFGIVKGSRLARRDDDKGRVRREKAALVAEPAQ